MKLILYGHTKFKDDSVPLRDKTFSPQSDQKNNVNSLLLQ